MIISPRSGSAGLLAAEGGTYPDYLPVSTTFNAEFGPVVINMRPAEGQAQSIYCRKIVIRIPTGPGSDALTTNAHAPEISIGVPEPGPHLPGKAWTTTLDTSSNAYAVVTCTPAGHSGSGFAEFKEGSRKVGFTFSQIAFAPLPDDIAITIEEETSYQPTSGYQTRQSIYDVRKYQA